MRSTDLGNREAEHFKLYCILVSRTASLGPVYRDNDAGDNAPLSSFCGGGSTQVFGRVKDENGEKLRNHW